MTFLGSTVTVAGAPQENHPLLLHLKELAESVVTFDVTLRHEHSIQEGYKHPDIRYRFLVKGSDLQRMRVSYVPSGLKQDKSTNKGITLDYDPEIASQHYKTTKLIPNYRLFPLFLNLIGL